MSEQPLLLFDIDGTLLVGDNTGHHAAIVRSLEEVYELDLSGFSFLSLEPWGKTDMQIALDALAAHDVPEPIALERLELWLKIADSRHLAVVTGAEHPRPEPAPAAAGTLTALAGDAIVGLLTGNIEGIARRKLRSAGLAKHFVGGPGGFGSDHRDRGELVGIARERAGGPHPSSLTVVIGDTPRDIACARAGGATCIAVTTGPFDDDALSEADAVIEGMSELPGALTELGFGVSPVEPPA